jgi:hypothetical protein
MSILGKRIYERRGGGSYCEAENADVIFPNCHNSRPKLRIINEGLA